VRTILQDIDEAHDLTSSQTQELQANSPFVPSCTGFPCDRAHHRGVHGQLPEISLHMDVDTYTVPPVEDYDIAVLPTDGNYDGNVIARRVSSTQSILVASPAYLERMGTPTTPDELIDHHVLRLKTPHVSFDQWRLLNTERNDEAGVFPSNPELR